MRKSKDIKAMKKQAGVTYRRGKTKDAYKLWENAAKKRLVHQGKLTDEEYEFWRRAQ